MRRSFLLVVVMVGVSLLVFSSASALEPQGSVLNRKPKQQVKKEESGEKEASKSEVTKGAVIKETAGTKEAGQEEESATQTEATTVKTVEQIEVSPEEKQRAAAARQTAIAEEQQVQARLRGLQALMEKEERLLAQRLAQAAQIRAKGLASNDQKMLDQAERYERQALDYYQKKVQQFENLNVATGTSEKSVRQQPTRQQPTRARSSATQTRSKTRR